MSRSAVFAAFGACLLGLGLGVWLSKTGGPPPSSPRTPLSQASVADSRSSAAGGAQARRVAELEERLDDQARRLQELERRLKRGEEQIVNFQVFVQKLAIHRGSEETTSSGDPALGQKQGQERRPNVPKELTTGAPAATALAALGPPDDRTDTELRYYEQGLRVLLDEFGAIERVEIFGEPVGAGPIDANGNQTGRFERGGKWYRPGKWAFHGVTTGMTGDAVVRRLGHPEEVYRDADGLFHLWFPQLSLKVVLALEAPQRVIKVRRGGGPPNMTANGFVD